MTLYPESPYKELRVGDPHLKPESRRVIQEASGESLHQAFVTTASHDLFVQFWSLLKAYSNQTLY